MKKDEKMTTNDNFFNEEKILIATPDTNMLGGVAAFYKSLNLETYQNISYFLIQHDGHRFSPVKKILSYPFKFFNFFWQCSKATTVVINPSFAKNSILRDALYLFIAKSIYKRKTIVFWHGVDEEFEAKAKTSPLYNYLMRRHYSRATQTIILSNVFKEKLEAFGYPSSHNFCLSSVAADDSYIDSFEIEKKYAEMQTVKLLFLSRIVSKKGIYQVIEIMDHLVHRKGIRNIVLYIAGDGEDAAEAKNRVVAKQLDLYVKFLGVVENDEKAQVLYSSHILLFPSAYCEGMPVSILEAMLFGIYIIASPRGGITDLISDRNGCLIDERDCDGYVSKIIELLNDPEKIKRVGLYNYSYSRNNYTSSIVKQKLHALFNKANVSKKAMVT